MRKTIAIRKWFSAALALLLLLTLLPQAAMAAGSLGLSGTRSVDKNQIFINETFNMNYSIDPTGSYVQRQPLDLAMVLDVSGSMGYPVSSSDSTKRIDALKMSSKLLTGSLATANYGDKVGVVSFSTSASMLINPTTDYNQVDQTINNLYPNGGTNIDYGLTLGYQMVKDSTQPKYIILLTDGYANYYHDDVTQKNVSDRTRARAEALQDGQNLGAQGIPVFTIALASSGSNVDTDLLQQIASDTGGQYYQASNQSELDQAFTSITQVLSPKITNITLTQPFPAGFELAQTISGITLNNNVLTINRADIPFNYQDLNYNGKISVPLKYTGSPATYQLDPAVINYKVDQTPGSYTINDPISLQFLYPQNLTLEGVASLGGGTADLNNWDIKTPLTVQYLVDPLKTADNLDGAITGALLVHTLPLGAYMAPGQTGVTSQPDATTGANALIMALPDIHFVSGAFDQTLVQRQAEVAFDHAGTYSFNPAAFLKVAYTDNNGQARETALLNSLPATVTVKVFLKDQWNNLYIGDGDGVVERQDSAGNLQWSVDLGDQPVKDMHFVDGSNESQIAVELADGSEQTLDLAPTAPSVAIIDYNGSAIDPADTAYKKGPAVLMLSGSVPGLPPQTAFSGTDFTGDYVHHYEYRIAGNGVWGPWNSVLPGDRVRLNLSGAGLQLEAHAVTHAIAGAGAVPAVAHNGADSSRTFSLDSTPPLIPAVIGDFTPTYGLYRFVLEGTVSDSDSGLTTDTDGKEIFTLTKSGTAIPEDASVSNFAFQADSSELAAGVSIDALDNVGWAAHAPVYGPNDTTPPSLALNDLNSQNPTDDPLIQITAAETESYIHNIRVWIDKEASSAPDKQGGTVDAANPRKSVLAFRLSEVIADQSGDDPKRPRYGWHKLIAEAENYSGAVQTATVYFKVNPGPIGTLAAIQADGSTVDFGASSSAANKPVKVTVDYQTWMPVPVKDGQAAVTVKEMYYAITSGTTRPSDSSTEWKKLGAGQFIVSRAGTSYVHLKLVDSDRIASPSDTRMKPLLIKINYDQNRY